MANRYWVGGTGTWNTTPTTNWSASSGGASGASVPTAADSVFFDQAGTYTVTCTGALTCLDITVSAGTVTFAQGTSPTFTISGSMSLIAGTVWSATGSITFNATTTGKTVTTNGVSISGSIIFNGAGGAWTLGSALTLASFVQVTAGTFDTSSINNYSVSCSQFGLNGTIARTVNLNGSTLTCSIASTSAFNASTITNLTFNAGTSQINLSGGSTSGISSSGLTFNNVSFTSAIATTIAITGANTFNTLSFAGRTSTGITSVTFSANQTISTLTLNAGTAAAYRTFLASDTIGTQRTLSVGTLTAGVADYDFRDIAITGAAAPLTGTRFGDCKGNSGITFDAAKTVYFRANSGTWGASGSGSWALTNGGSLNATAFPLAQDTAIFPSAYPASGSTVSISHNYNIGTIDMSARTSNTMTLATGTTTPAIYGNWINGTGTTLTGTGTLTFAGRGSQTITSAGVTFVQNMTFNNPGGSVTLLDAFTNTGSTSSAFALTQGDFSAASYNVSLPNIKFAISGSATRTLDFGSGTWSIGGTSGTAFVNSASNLTVTGTGVISMTGAIAKTFQGGGIQTYPTINQGGAGALTITGNNGFADITNTYSATGATTISFAAGTQTVSQFTASGTSGNLLTLNSSITGTQRTLTLTGGGTVSTNYLNVQDIAFTPGPATDGTTPYVWYLGANSTNSGNNTGGLFQAGGIGAIKVYQITNTATTSWTVPSDWNSSSNIIHLIGGGGGAGGSRTTSSTNKAGGAGGGGGGYTAVTNYSTTPSSSITVAVGTGGTAGTPSGGTGGTGGTTSWAASTATGGTGGSTTTIPTSVGGTGGSGTYSGGAGGAGSTTTTSGVIVTGGGGGGAAGPNGAGGAGGIGFANATLSNTAGGGGGGNGGGSAGGNASSGVGGTGGNNFGGTGGGASNTAGTNGGGGGGGVNSLGKTGGAGIDILNTIGGGGGTGGTAGTTLSGIIGGFYGGGGSGASSSASTVSTSGGAGAQGLIVIAYTPGAVVTSTGNFFLMFT